MYSWQYTLLNINLGLFTGRVAMMALTDYKNNRHYYRQQLADFKNRIKITENEASIGDIASAIKNDKGFNIKLKHKDFTLDLDTDYGKGACWHCDHGKLQMGIEGKKETTLYYSWTNMPTVGTLVLNGETIKLIGKTWFDKQGGPYSITNMNTQWEWFSLRFFNDEEMMLFTFPHLNKPYYDGTYIKADGDYFRLNDYQIKNTSVVEYKGLKWSSGWDLRVNDRHLIIEPIQEGHMNFAYFEELCYVKENDEIVGYAFAELLPGVLNKDFGSSKGKIDMSNLFKSVEF